MDEKQITSRSTAPITCEHVYNNNSNVCEVGEGGEGVEVSIQPASGCSLPDIPHSPTTNSYCGNASTEINDAGQVKVNSEDADVYDSTPAISDSSFLGPLSSEIADGCAQPSNSSGSRRRNDDVCIGDGYTPMTYPPQSNIRHACDSLRGCPSQLDSQSSPQSSSGSHKWKNLNVIIAVLGLVIGLIGAIASLAHFFS